MGNGIPVEFKNVKYRSLSDAAKALGLNYSTVSSRINQHGWIIEDALSKSIQPREDYMQSFGATFGKLMVLDFEDEKTKRGGPIALVRCNCAALTLFTVPLSSLRNGHTTKCKLCFQKEMRSRNGKQKGTYKKGYAVKGSKYYKLYMAHNRMKSRCRINGIELDPLWDTTPTIFVDWHITQGFSPDQRSPHRINKSGGYTINNVKWMTVLDHDRLHPKRGDMQRTKGKRSLNASLTDAQVLDIRARYKNNETREALAKAFCVSGTVIRDVVTFRNYRDVQ